jgi:Domain of unknown function (DUF4124)
MLIRIQAITTYMNTPTVFQRLIQAAAATTICLGSASSWAQWQWVDAQGKNVFSDIAPPTSVPEKNILRKPGLVPLDGGPSELTKKVGELKAGEEAQIQARKEQEAQVLAENCNRARRSQAGLQTGSRIGITNDKGEQDFMSDQARAAELQRLSDFIQSNCR